MNKKILNPIILVSIVGTLFVSAAYQGLLTSFYGFEYLELLFNTSLFFPVILFFSLIGYFTPEKVFVFWWKFAYIAIPISFLGIFIISLELHHDSGGWFNMDNDIDLLMYFVIYSIFIIGSVWQIWKGWRSA